MEETCLSFKNFLHLKSISVVSYMLRMVISVSAATVGFITLASFTACKKEGMR